MDPASAEPRGLVPRSCLLSALPGFSHLKFAFSNISFQLNFLACFCFNLFIYFWPCWVSLAFAHAFSSCSKQGPSFVAKCPGFSLQWLLCVTENRLSRAVGLQSLQQVGLVVVTPEPRFSSCGTWALWHMGLVAPRQVGSSCPRDGSHIS